MITPEQKRAREVLIKYAKRGMTITYSELCEKAKLKFNMSNPHDRDEIGSFLGDLSEHEFNMQRPIISSIVVSHINSQPGFGIYTLGEYLGWNFQKNEDGRMAWWIERLNNTHEFWKEYDGTELNDDEDSVEWTEDYVYPY